MRLAGRCLLCADKTHRTDNRHLTAPVSLDTGSPFLLRPFASVGVYPCGLSPGLQHALSRSPSLEDGRPEANQHVNMEDH